MRCFLPACFLLLPLLTQAQARPTAPAGIPSGHFQEIIYSRTDNPNGTIWTNDGHGMEYQLFGNGQIPKPSTNGWHLLYLRNTSPANPCFGGDWIRHDFNTSVHGGTDTVLFASSDYLVGYDFKDSDSSIVDSYLACLYHTSFGNRNAVSICNSTFDDGPDVRQQDGLIAYHNVTQSLFTVHLDGTQRQAIPNTTAFDVWPAWSPDGQWLLFGRSSSFYPQVSDYPFHVHNYYKVHPDGTGLTALTHYATTDSARFVGGGAWSPDGQAIIIGGTVNGRHGLWALKPDGSGQLDSIETTPGARINFVGSGANHVFGPSGLADEASVSHVTLFPNPAATVAMLRFAQPTSASGHIELLDALGRLVFDSSLPAGATQVELPVRDLKPGLYTCRWRTVAGAGTRLLRVQP